MIYLDHAATTPLDPRVRDAMVHWMDHHYGNPSSLHRAGQQASLAVNEARLAIANTFECTSEEVHFTASATEANHMIIRGVAHAMEHRGKHIITTTIEHSCVLTACAVLEAEGYTITRLPVDKDGTVRPEDFSDALRPDTILASIQFANHETGILQPMAALIVIAREHNIVLHSDGVAAFSTQHMGLEKFPLHCLTLAPHKYYGPQGVGIAIIRPGVPITPLLPGGSQEFGKRAGTPNVPGIIGAGLATTLMEAEKYHTRDQWASLTTTAREALLEAIPSLILFGKEEYRMPHYLPIGIPGTSGESLLVELDMAGLAISLGAACNSGSNAPSPVLLAMGYTPEEARSFLRITIGRSTTPDDLHRLVSTLISLTRS